MEVIAGPDDRTKNFDVILWLLNFFLFFSASALSPRRQTLLFLLLVITSGNEASWLPHRRLKSAVETWGRQGNGPRR
ncbi:hypothetical protein F4813DRAFT_346949 [Daldinia decipiens]|uniref:uncharacterized protein n=1 Tax=Daldinia decipiens TaxID=326647 RepID=UPI0020C53FE6|nr:uncharacterized protein F4813DRAFT_346949 [Daldinia decipiens]KAI1661265.1 hypothetical protein F4813DRAFT_346949 [Daldinia decipiens]